jgi:phospholipid/cholesterol/gamma-HCH transport system substrate-binding protein
MKESIESRLGLFFALAVVLALIILEYLGSFGFLQRGYQVHALFKNVQDLKPGDPVKMAGVLVGRVEKVELTNASVNVTMGLKSSAADVRTDSKASISFTGLMAQNYVAIDFGSPGAPKIEDGAILQTVEQPDLGQLFAKLDAVATGVENLTRSFSGEKIDTFLGPLTDFIKDNRTNVTATLSNLKIVSDRIVQGQGTVGKLINEDALYVSAQGVISNVQSNFQNVVAQVQGVTADAHTLMTNANQTITDARSGQGTVGKLLTDDSLYLNANNVMTNLNSITHKIDQGQGTVGQLINDDSLLKGAKLSLQKLDKATESLEDTGPLSILGTMVSSLF